MVQIPAEICRRTKNGKEVELKTARDWDLFVPAGKTAAGEKKRSNFYYALS
jgi:hypothetical protein